ncbi:membrane protein [Prolixibacter bellariivorans]|uniref:Membrane protein n=1 Tax=Prolixibacter bellariivorans TaxID=314319 RepID=A0A5M4AWF7_9BACT|nr:RagB/SusD family nutrient uptake outer membrane protein [Prolixibacter bellariivorans]GET31973.1 membrane protein [Prolixibacter bellariivorans]
MKKLQYILAIIPIVAFLSCSDSFLDSKQYASIDEQGYYNTPGAALKAVTNCYANMIPWGDWDYYLNRIEVGTNTTDDADAGGSDANDRADTKNLATGRPLTSNGELLNTWTRRYTGISRCNSAIEGISAAEKLVAADGSVVSEETKSRYISELKFLRAWFYFDLASTFGSVPLITETPVPTDLPAKSPIEDIRVQIINDIDECIADPNMPTNVSSDEYGRISKYVAYAFKARVCLFFAGLEEHGKMSGDANADYASALSAAKIVYDSQVFSLVPDYQNLFRGDYFFGSHASELSKECIFTVLREYVPGYLDIGYCTAVMYAGRGEVGGWGGNCPTVDFAESFDQRDPRKLFTVISSGDVFPNVDGKLITHTYTGYDNIHHQQSRKAFVADRFRDGYSLGDIRTDWAPYYIRYADVILMYAEALLKTGGDNQKVASLINEVRYRAFVSTSKKDEEATYRTFEETLIPVDDAYFQANLAVDAGDDLLKAIKNERRWELGMEGYRLLDLLRWGDYVSVMNAYYSEQPYANKGKLVSDNSWPFPIPQTEIDKSNGVLVQNGNY